MRKPTGLRRIPLFLLVIGRGPLALAGRTPELPGQLSTEKTTTDSSSSSADGSGISSSSRTLSPSSSLRLRLRPRCHRLIRSSEAPAASSSARASRASYVLRSVAHASVGDFDPQTAVVAGAPPVRLVERPYPHGARQLSRGEDEVQLAGRRVRRLAVRVIRRDVLAFPRELPRPWIGLASVWRLRADEGESVPGRSRPARSKQRSPP